MKLTAENLRKGYDGRYVLDGVSFAVASGETLLITGESGCGKTTLVRLILGLEKPDDGIFRVDGRETVPGGRTLTAAAVFQENRLCGSRTALDNIIAAAHSLSKAAVREEIARLLPPGNADKRVAALSGGMQRRVAILRACLAESDILVMDEPLTGLDRANAAKVLDYIEEKRCGRPLIMTAHHADGLKYDDRLTLERL